MTVVIDNVLLPTGVLNDAMIQLIVATGGVALQPAPIRKSHREQIEKALRPFTNADRDGPYSLLLHAAEIAVCRPELDLAIVTLNNARALTLKLLGEVR